MALYSRLYAESDVPLALSDHQIRVVTLHLGTFDDPLVCSLGVIALENSSYEALSYTWGSANDIVSTPDDEWEDIEDDEDDDDDVENGSWESNKSEESEKSQDHRSVGEHGANAAAASTICVNGMLVPVMPNLSLALRHIRSSIGDRTLWIDYLCINQDSVDDRNAQVRRMDTIYRGAQRVIIWLGPKSNDSDHALDLVEAMNSYSHLADIYNTTFPRLSTHEVIKPILKLLSRSWWTRVWVIQEVCLARDAIIRVGHRTMPWEWFVIAARTFGDHLVCCASVISPSDLTDEQKVDDFDDLRLAWPNVLSFEYYSRVMSRDKHILRLHDLLRIFYNRESTDPRDRIFGLLGLLDPASRLIEADYGKSAEEVFEPATTAIIQESGKLSIILDIDEDAGQVEDTATWSPDWTLNGVSQVINFEEQFSASGALSVDVRPCGPHTLQLAGSVFDNIVAVDHGKWSENQGSLLFDAYKSLKRWEKMAQRHFDGPGKDPEKPEYRDFWLTVKSYLSGEERKRALWQTVLLGMSADRSRRLRDDDYDDYQRWRDWLRRLDGQPCRQSPDMAVIASDDKTIRDHNEVLNGHLATRWFFLTEDGFMGMGPKHTEPYDVVAVLAGSRVPFVLRPLSGGCPNCGPEHRKYQVMGWAYLHGIMDGETVKEIEDDTASWLSLCLV